MTVKLVVLYTEPADPEAFDHHYLGTHMPLVAKMPGLLRAESGKFSGRNQPYYRSAGLWFADQEALNASAGSPEGQAVSADYAQIAPEGSLMMIQNLDD
jgi:uncharacterized protein (TIGR02118 family)